MSARERKQAVVFIHGIGEQIPMDTLRGFVRAVWETDDSLRRQPGPPSTVWSKPDNVSGNYELRRLTTAQNTDRRRTDFFELFWADLMSDTKLSQLTAWIKVLLWRRPSRVPQQLRGMWWFLVILASLIVVGFAIYKLQLIPGPKWVAPVFTGVATVVWFVVSGFLINYAGDAARYLHVAPPNIASRRNVREAGIQLLQKLHEGTEYERIMVVGHSLGSVIGYDILTHLWPRYYFQHANAENEDSPMLRAAEALACEPAGSADFAARFQRAQSACLEEIQRQGNQWRVTDFVTLGSPLAHAPFLLARNETEFSLKKSQREFPTCPPTMEPGKRNGIEEEGFSYEAGKLWVPHHAAVFAVTRWTNLYFPATATIWGDVIGGPVAPAFGRGVADVAVTTDIDRGRLSHTHYWDYPHPQVVNPPPTHIVALRKAVRICVK